MSKKTMAKSNAVNSIVSPFDTHSVIGKAKERSFTVVVNWEVSKDYEVKAKTRKEAQKKILEILNRGDICVWTDGFETTDNVNVKVR